MSRVWFRPWGWLYVPISWQGAVITALVLLFCGQIFVAIDRQSHSVSDTLYGVFPYFVCTVGIYFWVAAKTSARTKPIDS